MGENSTKIEDMDQETAEKLGVLDQWKKANRKPRETKFSKEQVRSNSMRVLNVIANLTQRQRERVLNHSLKLNEL